MRQIIFNIKRFSVFALLLGGFASLFTHGTRAAGVSLSAVPTANTVTVGQTANYTIKINRDGYGDKVTLSAANLPAGVTAVFTPNATTAASSVLKLQTSTGTPTGTFTMTVKATAVGLSIAPLVVQLTTTVAGSVSISVLPSAQQIVAGQATVFEISISRHNYDGPTKLSAANVPPGVTVRFEPETTGGNSSRMYLYSNGLPFAENSFLINVAAAPTEPGISPDAKPVELVVNCGIVWGRQFNAITETDPVTDYATAVTYDAAGNVYVGGHRDDAFDHQESWIAKYDAQGNRQWIRPVQDGYFTYTSKPTDIAVDSAGNVYVAGILDDEGDYTRNNTTPFIGKYDAGGNLLRFHHDLSVIYREDNGSRGIALNFNSAGNLVLTVVMDVVISWVSNPSQTLMLPSGTFDLEQFVFNANFDFVRTELMNDQPGLPSDIGADAAGAIYITGTHLRYPGLFRNQVFVWKYVPGTSQVQWSVDELAPVNRQTENFFNRPAKILVTGGGDVFVSGSSLEIPLSPLNPPVEYWQTKVSAGGTRSWLQKDLTVNAEVSALAVDAAGDLYYGGSTENSLGAINFDHLDDIWFAKRAGGDGRLIYVKQFHSPQPDALNSIAVNPAGDLLLAGKTRGLLQSTAGDDSLLMKFTERRFPLAAPRITSVNPTNVNPGGLFLINGVNLGNIQAVFHNDRFLPFIVNSTSQVTATAPDGLSGYGSIAVAGGCFVTGFSLN